MLKLHNKRPPEPIQRLFYKAESFCELIGLKKQEYGQMKVCLLKGLGTLYLMLL